MRANRAAAGKVTWHILRIKVAVLNSGACQRRDSPSIPGAPGRLAVRTPYEYYGRLSRIRNTVPVRSTSQPVTTCGDMPNMRYATATGYSARTQPIEPGEGGGPVMRLKIVASTGPILTDAQGALTAEHVDSFTLDGRDVRRKIDGLSRLRSSIAHEVAHSQLLIIYGPPGGELERIADAKDYSGDPAQAEFWFRPSIDDASVGTAPVLPLGRSPLTAGRAASRLRSERPITVSHPLDAATSCPRGRSSRYRPGWKASRYWPGWKAQAGLSAFSTASSPLCASCSWSS
jgi:hypothetical protein